MEDGVDGGSMCKYDIKDTEVRYIIKKESLHKLGTEHLDRSSTEDVSIFGGLRSRILRPTGPLY
jgi:hypothetical protein